MLSLHEGLDEIDVDVRVLSVLIRAYPETGNIIAG